MMHSENLYIFNINPDEVFLKMQRCKLDRYTNYREWDDSAGRWVYPTDWAFADITAIPLLYRYVVSNPDDWTPETMKKLLIQYRAKKGVTPPAGRTESDIPIRANKLVLDFCRELHTYALLSFCRGLSYVKYEKVYDVSKNIDYSAAVVLNPGRIGIQASMRNKWYGNQFDAWKRRRRSVKIDNKPFKGPLFFLTNKDIPGVKCPQTGTWLFSDDHIEALIEDIKSEVGSKMDVDKVAIQAKPQTHA